MEVKGSAGGSEGSIGIVESGIHGARGRLGAASDGRCTGWEDGNAESYSGSNVESVAGGKNEWGGKGSMREMTVLM